MAEPVILSYARGLLKEFPGVPEGTVDVIPVDHVVAAIIAVAAVGPSVAAPITQVASGSVNPLKYSTLVDNVRAWFTEHPLYDAKGQPIVVPDWTFPGRGRVQGQLQRAKSVFDKAESVLQALPLRGTQATWSAKLEEKRAEVDRALEYVELYGLYTECEAIYSVDNLLALWDHIEEHDRQAFWFDPRVIDWPRFVTETHLPSVVHHGRVKTTPGKSKSVSRATRTRNQVLSTERHMAAFDLENTLIASNVVASYSWLATRRLGTADKTRYVLRTLREAPSLLALDRKDRSDFLRFYYRRYEDAPVAQIAEDSQELFSALILTKSFPAAIRRVREHKALGHRTVLITGALDFVVEPLRPLFDEIIAAELSVGPDGRYLGEMRAVPPTGETRAQALADYCAAEGLKMSESVAYADSTSDLPMLEAVGFPVAVEPGDAIGGDRPQAGLAGRAVVESTRQPATLAPRRLDPRRRPPRLPGSEHPMKALQIDRKLSRFAAARIAGAIQPGAGATFGPLELVDVDPPELPGPGWEEIRPRLSGICGSDLSTIDGTASRYFEPIVSFPFIPGHEVVADATGSDGTTRRVVVEPVLGCVTRGIDPVCPSCAAGDLGNCQRLAFGAIEPGLQTGFCCDTGGGWGTTMVAHTSQLHDVPQAMSDDDAVLVEPTACAIHGALRAEPADGQTIVVLGAGTLGLLTVAALRRFAPGARIVVNARYAEQIRLAKVLGADVVSSGDELPRLIRSLTGSMAYGNQLTGGCDTVVDCVGSDASIAQSLAIVKPRGRVVLVGMPGKVRLELTTLWHRETQLVGAYAYGTETLPDGARRRTFDLALELAQSAGLGRLLSYTYPLAASREAIEHAAAAGRRGAVKIAFDLRGGQRR